jgi:hypothetical protein
MGEREKAVQWALGAIRSVHSDGAVCAIVSNRLERWGAACPSALLMLAGP